MLADNIQFYREQEGLTQEGLAFQLGVDASMVGHYEAGRKRPNVDRLLQLADIFNITLDELVEGE
jgi:transcriptional regulator with XRE-family HTH domain